MLQDNQVSQPSACSKAVPPTVAAVAEALSRDDLASLPRVGGPTHVSGFMEIVLQPYGRIAREPNENPE